MTEAKYIAIDFETYLISEGEVIPRPVCLSFYYDDPQKGMGEGLRTTQPTMHRLLKWALESGATLIAHNMSFEAAVIYKHFPDLFPLLQVKMEEGKVYCTKIYEQLIDNTREKPLYKFDLASIVNNYYQEDISDGKKNPDSWRLRYSELDGIPYTEWPTAAINYAIQDSIWAYKVFKTQQVFPHDYKLSVETEIYLNLMGSLGIAVNTDRAKELEAELWEKLTPMYKHLEETGYAKRDPKGKLSKNTKILRGAVEAKISKPEYTTKGDISISNESLARYLPMLPEGDELKGTLECYMDVMKYEKVLTSFVNRIVKAEDAIRTSYRSVVSSGRTSSSSSSNYASVNIQQMPRKVDNVTWDVRNCFIPRPGYKIVSIDYSGLELASTAHTLSIVGSGTMAKLINSGNAPVDMHSMLAYRLMNSKEGTKETYDSFVKRKKEEPYSRYRQLAKPINLGFPGGIGYDTMRTILSKEGIALKFKVLEESVFENRLTWKARKFRKMGYPVRIRQVKRDKFQLVYDELISLKDEMFNLYPDLGEFLSETHKQYLTGHEKRMKDEFGVWKKEPMYQFQVGGFKRDWCMYTQFCNGYLMQSPSAIGAKSAMVAIIKKYLTKHSVNPLAFIHDEVLFEVIDDKHVMEEVIGDVSETMIDEMSKVLYNVRIAVEAEAFDYWKKAGGFYEKTFWKNPGDSKLYTK